MKTLTENTKIKLSMVAVFAVISGGMALSWTAATQWSHARHEIEEVRREQEQIKVDVKEAQETSLSIAAAAESALREAIANPGHAVPDPRDPNVLIIVKDAKTTSEIPSR